MISFVSTFPPIICGIGTYMHYILDHITRSYWKVISFKLNEFAASNEVLTPYWKAQIDYCLSFPHPTLLSITDSHDGKENFFFEVYIPEDIFPKAFRALDFTVFWCNNATQSGRLAHAQGAGSFVVGRDWEGIGETLKLSGLPAPDSEQTVEIRDWKRGGIYEHEIVSQGEERCTLQ